VAGEALWPFALEAYARPGAEAILLELQDAHGQCVPYLIWSLWLASQGRPLTSLQDGAGLARAWQEAAVAPLRDLRRGLERPSTDSLWRPREQLRERVKALELEAERMLLQMLEAASPPAAGPPSDPQTALEVAARAWGGGTPRALLRRLAQAIG
jgi:uncharacterized protein (TIGR02444 family)